MQKYSPLAQHSRRLLLTLFGGISGWTLFSVCCFLLLSGVLVNVATDAVKPVFEKLKPELLNCISNEVFATVLLLIALVLLLMILKWQAHKALTKDRLAVLKSETPAVDVLVQFLSELKEEQTKQLQQLLQTQGMEGQKAQVYLNISDELFAFDIPDILKTLPWLMNLLAVRAQFRNESRHRKVLDLVVLTSKESAKQFQLFEELISNLFPGRVRLLLPSQYLREQCFDNIVEFTDMQTLYLQLQRIQQHAKLQSPKQTVCFDATSGSKICSIAASMVSLSQTQGVQYVNEVIQGSVEPGKPKEFAVQSYQLQYSKAEQ